MMTCGECGVPDERESVVEDEGWVGSGVTGVHLVRPIVFRQLHLHELNN